MTPFPPPPVGPKWCIVVDEDMKTLRVEPAGEQARHRILASSNSRRKAELKLTKLQQAKTRLEMAIILMRPDQDDDIAD